MKLKTFKLGGIHPEENKFSAKAAITPLALPTQVSIPLGQHLGAPANPLVKVGDKVKVGTKIAEASSFISANIHSSVSGTVEKIEEILDTSGYRKKAILIKVEGDEWEESIDRSTHVKREIELSKEEIIARVKEAGIVGLGGATFPTHVKLMIPPGKMAEVIIINGVECEPYLTADHRLMLEKAEEILIGCQIAMKATAAKKIVIGIENNKPDAISKLNSLLPAYPQIEVMPLKVQYPQGGEKQLLKATLGRDVPSGNLPIELGAVVINIGTIYSIYQAAQKNYPLIERVVTATGKSLSRPSNFLVRIGTSIQSVIEAAGGLPEDSGKIINGGPMMGKALMETNVPVTKGTSGILIIKEEDSKRKTEGPCIRCSKCVTVCPMGLEPFLLAKLSNHRKFETLETEYVMDCIECGSCSFTCPANKPLLDHIRMGKAETGKLIRERNK